jgi:hypothetical protein
MINTILSEVWLDAHFWEIIFTDGERRLACQGCDETWARPPDGVIGAVGECILLSHWAKCSQSLKEGTQE